jgi:hypothetical protein
MSRNRRLRASLAAVAAMGVLLSLAAPADAAPPKRVAPPVISVSPTSPTNQRTATFTWTESTTGVTFACSFDAVTVPCGTTQSKTFTNLSGATHTFTVRASRSGWKTASASKTLTVDLTRPTAPTVSAPAITRLPAAPTFSSTSLDLASYECSLDGADYTACTSGTPVPAAPDGRHTFDVRAIDKVGNISDPTQVAWLVDTFVAKPFVLTGPNTQTTSTSASFTFGSHESDATFECAIDGGAYAACTSGKLYTGLTSAALGVPHSFRVRATDVLGNQAESDVYTWTVKNAINSWLIAFDPGSLPNAVSKLAAGSIAFSTVAVGSASGTPTLTCDIDGTPVASCTSPVAYAGLADGSHTLTVVADENLASENTAAFAWEIDSTPPATPDLFGPPDRTNQTSVSVVIVPSTLDDLVTCTIDGVPASPACSVTQPVSASGLADGSHTVIATEHDSAGNTSSASVTWTVDTVAPVVLSVTAPTSVSGPATVVLGEDALITTTSPGLALASGTPVASRQVCLDASSVVVECDAFDVRAVRVFGRSPLIPGERYLVTVNAPGAEPTTDVAGNPAPTTTTGFRAALVQQESSPVTVQGWRKVAVTAAKGGSYLTENRRGAYATWTFSGTSFGAWLVAGPTFGYAKVYVDGVLKGTFNQYASAARFTSVRVIKGLAAGTHKVKVVVTGTKGSKLAKGAYVGVDAFSIGATVQKTPAVVTTWAAVAVKSASGGRRAVAGLAGETFSMTFAGTGVRWAHPTGPGFGIAKVYVDGVLKATVDSWSSTAREQVLWASPLVLSGRHTVRIVVTGTKRAAATGTAVGVDSLLVR